MKPLDGVSTVWQHVYSLQDPSSVKSGQCGDVHFRHDGDILFGVVTLDEMHFAGNSGTPLQNASQHAYEHLFAAMQGTGFPYLLRCWNRSEEHTSELQSLMRISYAVFCLKKKKQT